MDRRRIGGIQAFENVLKLLNHKQFVKENVGYSALPDKVVQRHS